jgi:hypothetical protein
MEINAERTEKNAMSLIPADRFEQNDPLEGERVSIETARNERVVPNVSPINEVSAGRRVRSAPDVPVPSQVEARVNSPLPAAGSPLPAGSSLNKTKDAARNNPPGRSLAVPEDAPEEDVSTAHRALNTMKQALPLVQKLLPLLDGNVVAAVSNLLAPKAHAMQKVDLAPLESHITDIQLMNHDLRSKVTEQNTSLKRVEDQLEMVKEATDRNTLEQQELMEDLRSLGSKFNLFAALIFGLLVLSVILNLLLFMHLKQALP